jgi:hypothetical protein
MHEPMKPSATRVSVEVGSRMRASSPLRVDKATRTWLALVAFTLLGAAAVGHGGHPLWRLAAAWLVALVCGLKARLLLRGYLRPRDAGPVFERLIRLFAAVTPVLLGVTALVEACRALH